MFGSTFGRGKIDYRDIELILKCLKKKNSLKKEMIGYALIKFIFCLNYLKIEFETFVGQLIFTLEFIVQLTFIQIYIVK